MQCEKKKHSSSYVLLYTSYNFSEPMKLKYSAVISGVNWKDVERNSVKCKLILLLLENNYPP